MLSVERQVLCTAKYSHAGGIQERASPAGRTYFSASMRIRTLLVLATSLAACKAGRDNGLETSSHLTRPSDTAQKAMRPDTLLHADPETLAVAAKDPAATDQIARIEPFRGRLDSLLGSRNPELRLYARLGKDDQHDCIEPIDSVVAVADPEKWPANTETSLIVVVEQGRVLAVREIPTSCSGDWNNTYTHTFDTTGVTVSFERFSGFFNGCPGTAHEISTYYFAPATGLLLGKRYSMSDPDGKAFAPSECQEFNYHYPYTIFSNWPVAARALHLPSVIR